MVDGQRGDELGSLRARITVLERALEDARKAAEAHLITMFETVPDGIFITDLDGGIRQVNRAAWTMLGCQGPGELIGRSTLSVIVPKERDRARKNFSQVLRETRVLSSEHTVMPLRGEPFPVEINGAFWRIPAENPWVSSAS